MILFSACQPKLARDVTSTQEDSDESTDPLETEACEGAGVPVQLRFQAQPSPAAVAGIVFTTQPKVEIRDSCGSIVSTASDSVTLSAFSDSSCTTPLAGGTLAGASANASGGVASFSGVSHTLAGSLHLKASSGSLGTACSEAVVISPAEADHLVLIAGDAQTAAAGTAVADDPAVRVVDAYGNPVSGTVLTFTISGGGGSVSASTATSDASGLARVEFTLGTTPGANGLDVARQTTALPGTPATLSFSATAVAGPAAKLDFTTTAQTLTAGNCSALTTIQTQDAHSNATTVSSDTAIGLSGPGMTFYSDSSCATVITDLTLSNGAGSGSFYFKPTQAGSAVTLTVSATGLTSGAQDQIINPASPVKLGFSGPDELTAGECVKFQVQSQDTYGNPSNVTADKSFNLSGRSQGLNYSNSTCTAMTSDGQTINAGTSSVTYYYKNTLAESTTFTASGASGLSNGSLPVTVKPAAPSKLVIIGSNTHEAGACSSSYYTVSSRDEYDNAAPVSADTTVALAGAGSGAFYEDAGCTTTVTARTIPTGSAISQRFYLKNPAAESPVLTADATGITQGTLALSPFAGTLAAGYNHSCQSLADGTAQCWGYNYYGQLGDGTNTDRTTPVAVSGLTGVATVTVGSNYSCALLNDGTVKCWGHNYFGQLGDSTTTSRNTPVAVSGISGAVAIAVGANHTCALLNDATVRCWGYNYYGQLGDDSTSNRTTPVAVTGLTGAVSIDASVHHTCAILNDGTARCWGYNGYGNLGDGTNTNRRTPVAVTGLENARQIVGGQFHSCALLDDGTARCWGYGGYGQLGNGTTTTYWTATPVRGLGTAIALSDSYEYHGCALMADATSKCWGYNFNGQLGDGTTSSRYTPTPVSGLADVVQVTAGHRYSCALHRDGSASCWGINDKGQLGSGKAGNRLLASPVSGITNAVAASAGGEFTCALLNDGTVKCWGQNNSGQLGDGTSTDRLAPAAVSGLTNATAIGSGSSHSCALLGDGTVQCWGYNGYGQLGDASYSTRTTPIAVSGISGATAISVAQNHGCALLGDGTAKCWGANSYGQLGDGSTTHRNTPVAVSGLSGAVAIAAGDTHSCAFLNDGTAQCWGQNNYGQLGDGTTTSSTTPVAVELEGATAAFAGSSQSCAILKDGTVKCWGVYVSSRPSLMNDLSSVTALSMGSLGGWFSCARIYDGTVRCWGDNSYGQLGNGNLASSVYAATQVIGPSEVSSVAAGYRHACAVSSDGLMQCWGSNDFGKLGTGQVSNSTTPTPVLPASAPKKLLLSGAAVVSAGECSAALSVTAADLSGNASPVAETTEVFLMGAEAGTFFGDSSCTAPLSSVTIAAGQSSATLYFKSDEAAYLLLSAHAAWLDPGTRPYTVVPGAPARLVMSGPAVLGGGTCSSRYDVSTQDSLGNLSNAASDMAITLSGQGSGSFYSDSSCSTAVTSLTLAAGSNTQMFYFKGSTAESLTLQADAAGLTSGTLAISVTNRLTLSGPASVTAGGCSAAFSVTHKDGSGTAVNVSVNTTVSLAGQGGGSFYSDSSCATPVTSVIIGAGTSSKGFYFKNTTKESLLFVASADGLAQGTLPVTINADSSTHLAVTGPASWLAGSCSSAFSVISLDVNGNTSTVASDTTITLSGQGSGGFYSDSGCTTAVSSVTIGAGTHSQVFYFKGGSPESLTLAADATGFVQGTLAFAVITRIVISGPSSLPAGTCSSAFTVTTQDAAGTAINVSANTTVSLSGQGSGNFYSDSSCSTSVTSVVISAGTSSQTFYFRDLRPESLLLAAAATGQSGGTHGLSVEFTQSSNIAAGGIFTCAVLDGGTVQCWGHNGYGQLGDGTYLSRFTPVEVAGLTGATAADVGYFHACALLGDGTVQCWGSGSYGQLGNGSTSSYKTPVIVSGIGDATAIASGDHHNCALLSDGTVKCWGYNGYGQLGDATTTNRSTPVTVSGLSGAVAIAAGMHHSCALLSDGTVKCWGYNYYGQLGDDTATNRSAPVTVAGLSGATGLAGGQYHSCAVLGDGTAQCWGSGYARTPTSVSGLSGVAALSAGNWFTCAVLTDATARCWGSNSYGQLGDGTLTTSSTPVAVSGLSGVSEISAGAEHTCAALVDGKLHCWGRNQYGQLGNGEKTSRGLSARVTGLSGVSDLSLHSDRACVVQNDGTVRCWGYNYNGQLGDGSNLDRGAPVAVSGLAGAASVITGLNHSCAVLSDGSAKCWGQNNYGQLGDGTSTDSNTPVAVSGLTGVSSISIGQYHTCALLTDGTARCWGLNTYGQLGDGSSITTRSTPVTVSGLAGAVELVVDGSTSCALLGDGTAKCWGNNNYGRLGDGTSTNRSTPVAVSGLSGATRLVLGTGSNHACAVLGDGTAKCWGYNNYGQLGDGTNTTRYTPVTVSGLTGAASIAPAPLHTCAVLGDGTAKCWGYNGHGQLGDGTNTTRYTPEYVSDLTGVSSLLMSNYHSCALLDDGTARCWGWNAGSRLGDGTVYTRYTPVRVKGLRDATSITLGIEHGCALIADGTVECWGNNLNGRLGLDYLGYSTTPLSVLPVSAPTKLILSGPLWTTAGSCVSLGILAADYLGDPANVTVDTTVRLVGGGAGGAFYSDASCSTPVRSVMIPAGTSSGGTVYFSGTKAEPLDLMADYLWLDTGTLKMTVEPADAAKLLLTGPASLGPGACSEAYTVTLTDLYDNPHMAMSDTAVALSGQGSGAFYLDASCAIPVESVTIPKFGISEVFYFKNGATESLMLEAGVDGLDPDTLSVNVN